MGAGRMGAMWMLVLAGGVAFAVAPSPGGTTYIRCILAYIDTPHSPLERHSLAHVRVAAAGALFWDARAIDWSASA